MLIPRANKHPGLCCFGPHARLSLQTNAGYHCRRPMCEAALFRAVLARKHSHWSEVRRSSDRFCSRHNRLSPSSDMASFTRRSAYHSCTGNTRFREVDRQKASRLSLGLCDMRDARCSQRLKGPSAPIVLTAGFLLRSAFPESFASGGFSIFLFWLVCDCRSYRF